MTIKFNPISDEDIQMNHLKPGHASFRVIDALECQSKAGNPMIKLKLDVIGDNGATGTIFDFLVFTDAAIWKVSQFCKSIGMPDLYKSGEISGDFLVSKCGSCELGEEDTKVLDKQSGIEVVKKFMRIKNYIFNIHVEDPKNPSIDKNLDDDLPF